MKLRKNNLIPTINSEVQNKGGYLYGKIVDENIISHLERAQEKLISEPKASCLESINTIESAVKAILGNKKTLSDNISSLESKYNLHKTLSSILKKLYGFRGGLAHGAHENQYNPRDKDAVLCYYMAILYIEYLDRDNKVIKK